MLASLRIALAALALVSCAGLAHADDELPALRARVNDYASLLPADRAAALEARLADFEARTGHQFALLTVASLGGRPIEDFSIKVAEQWKLGGKKEDDGLILVIAPNDKQMRIEVGYGLEGMIPDAIAARVIREVLAPAFRSADYAGGIDSAFAVLMHAAGGGGEAPKLPARSVRKRAPVLFGPLLFPLIVFFVISMLGRGGRRRHGFYAGPGIGFGMGRGGGWGGGGGGGGGFGGGRGGGFGGGGASGGW